MHTCYQLDLGRINQNTAQRLGEKMKEYSNQSSFLRILSKPSYWKIVMKFFHNRRNLIFHRKSYCIKHYPNLGWVDGLNIWFGS